MNHDLDVNDPGIQVPCCCSRNQSQRRRLRSPARANRSSRRRQSRTPTELRSPRTTTRYLNPGIIYIEVMIHRVQDSLMKKWLKHVTHRNSPFFLLIPMIQFLILISLLRKTLKFGKFQNLTFQFQKIQIFLREIRNKNHIIGISRKNGEFLCVTCLSHFFINECSPHRSTALVGILGRIRLLTSPSGEI